VISAGHLRWEWWWRRGKDRGPRFVGLRGALDSARLRERYGLIWERIGGELTTRGKAMWLGPAEVRDETQHNVKSVGSLIRFWLG
jgi:hypothetical protein